MRSDIFRSISAWLARRASRARADISADDAGRLDWMATARDAPAFVLDACFSAPAHVPGWLLEEGARDSPLVESLALPTRGSFVAAGVALGNEAMLVEHYRRILAAAPPPAARRTDLAPFQCFEVDIAITFAAEVALHIDMFGGSARAALPRLQSVHAALVRGIGEDLWNVRRCIG